MTDVNTLTDQTKAQREEDDREVFVQFSHVEEAQRDIERLLASLTERLEPVLRPERDEKSGVSSDPRESMSPVAERLASLNLGQVHTVARLRDLVARLGV